MSNPMRQVAEDILRTAEAQFHTLFNQRTASFLSGGKVLASSLSGVVPGAAIVHAIQSAIHSDADHTTVPVDGDVFTWDGTHHWWTPRAPTGGGTTTSGAQLIESSTGAFIRETSNDRLIQESPA